MNENARRIVACVNACAGIDTELLEIIADNDKTLAGVIANVEKQRDELLAELEKAANYHASHECYSEAKRVRDFITGVKGEH